MSGRFRTRKDKKVGIAKVTDAGGSRHTSIHDDDSDSFRRDDGSRVEERLQLRHLQQLLFWFQNHEPTPTTGTTATNRAARPGKGPVRQAGLLTLDEFKVIIWKVLCTHDYDDQLDNLFTKLDTTCDGYVDWNELCTYMLLQFRENDYMRAKKQIPFQAEPKIRHIVHNRQETTTKIVAAENPTKYVTVSKEGAICVWDTTLHFERHLGMTEAEESAHVQKRRVKEWVTDTAYMPNCHKLVIASTGRDLRFFDTSSQYYEEFHLFAMPDVPTCLTYYFTKSNLNGESLLMYGDEHGAITIIHFLKPMSQMFATPFKKEEGVAKIYFQDLYTPDKFVKLSHLEDVHSDVIRKMLYLPENDCIMSSSASPVDSIVIMDVMRRKKRYTFKISKGVDCFDYNKNVNILVTGNADHMVRVWNPYVVSKPVAILDGHHMAIVDVVIHEGLSQIFSLSRDTVLKVWDVKEHVCLQTVIIKFPSSLMGRMPEYGPFTMHLQASPNVLLVTANDYIAQLKVGQSGPPVSSVPTTHVAQLSSAIYNPFFKMVVTGADDSTVAVWDVETGTKNMLYTSAHGKEEITCMCFDNTWRRLITGARNGTIKVWNVQNGHNLHNLEAVMEAEVTGLVPLVDRKVILSVGWSRLITQYEDNDPDSNFVKCNNTWKAGQVHEEDVLCVAYCPPAMMATADYNGEIYVWSLETESLFLHLKKRSKLTSSSSALHRQSPNSRPNSRHRKSHRPSPGQPPPVDELLFLNGRAKVKRTEAAILISSEAGTLRWWSLYAKKHELGYFYAPEGPDESVLGLCTNTNNSVLVSGDTQGRVSVWSICAYCTQPRDHRVRTRPPLEHGWQAHDSAVVSVDYVEHDTCAFILSASTDWTAKLWSLDGNCVGTFGQKQPWNIRSPSTWVDPPPDTVSREEGTPSALPDLPEEKDLDDDDDIPVIERGETLVTETGDDHLLHLPRVPKAASVGPTRTRNQGDLRLHDRSQTFTFGSSLAGYPTKNLLGSTVEGKLAQVTQDRHERRDQYGEIDSRQTSRMGKLCCPFQALATQNLTEILLPENLPLPARMVSRGYTNETLTLDNVQSMDLSYYSDAQQQQPSDQLSPVPNGLNITNTRELSDANRTGSQHGRKSVVGKLLPSIGKGRTFIGGSSSGRSAAGGVDKRISVVAADSR